jgi:hypothetical protein
LLSKQITKAEVVELVEKFMKKDTSENAPGYYRERASGRWIFKKGILSHDDVPFTVPADWFPPANRPNINSKNKRKANK